MSLEEKQDQEDLSAVNKPEEVISQEAEHSEESSTKTGDKSFAQFLETFTNELAKQPDAESKLKIAIQFMEGSLAQGGTPHFKSFWEARKVCLDLFKENIAPGIRTVLWSKYTELSKEARRLKEILDEQTAFAVEQIEIAVNALEKDITDSAQHLEKAPIAFDIPCRSLSHNMSFYESVQRELNHLNTQASRINALRKELMRTEMRVRQKNKFFQRLSAAGDKVFPRRKELIKEISQRFIDDVNAFVNAHFQEGVHEALFALREEIKALQGIAKILTLNTHSFTQTRTRLSECWDKIKELDKERKKVRAQQKSAFRQNAEAVQQRIQEFSQGLASNEISLADANKKLDEISSFMRSIELGKDEVRELREELAIARKPILEKMKEEEQARQNQELERDRLKKEKVLQFQRQIEDLIRNIESYEIEQLFAERDALLAEIGSAGISKAEKQDLERLLKPFRDMVAEKKERALMALSDDDRQALQQIKDMLKERKERRQEIKNQLEVYRKAAGSSGLDFEQAMKYNAQMNTEKEQLERVNQAIKELERKIQEVEKKA